MTAPAYNHNDMEIDLRGVLLLLWSRKVLILGCVLVGMAITALMLSFITPRYDAQTALIVNANDYAANVPKNLQFVSMDGKDTDTRVLNEIEILKSRNFAAHVIRDHNLFGALNMRNAASQTQPQKFKNFSVPRGSLRQLPKTMTDDMMRGAISHFLGNLSVRNIAGSSVIYIGYTAPDPVQAATVANAVAHTYINRHRSSVLDTSLALNKWLEGRLKNLKSQMDTADQAVAKYKSDNHILAGQLTQKTLTEINQERLAAKIDKDRANAKLDQLKSGDNGSPDILNAQRVTQLRGDEARIKVRIADLSTQYGPKHPVMIKNRSELSSVRAQINAEMQNAKNAVQSEYDQAVTRLQAAQSDFDAITHDAMSDQTALVGLQALEREADTTRAIYDAFLETYKRADTSEALQNPAVRILSYAVVPRAPSYPNRRLFLSLAMVVSLFTGIALALLLEKTNNTYRAATHLERDFDLPCFASIPALYTKRERDERGRYVLDKPVSLIAESMKTLKSVIGLTYKAKPRVIAVTSSYPGEGKSLLSLWLARLAAKGSDKTILIDCDLRRPTVHTHITGDEDKTLVDYLTGRTDLHDIIQKDPETGLDVILSAQTPNTALDLISSNSMSVLISVLKETYDTIILDTPACLAVADARVLSTHADIMLYAVEWNTTPKEAVAAGIKHFKDIHYTSLAFVLNKINVAKHAMYGY